MRRVPFPIYRGASAPAVMVGVDAPRIDAGMCNTETLFVPIWHRPLLTADEAAALTGIPVKIVRAAVRSGDLPARYAGSSTARIRRSDLDAWVDELPEDPLYANRY